MNNRRKLVIALGTGAILQQVSRLAWAQSSRTGRVGLLGLSSAANTTSWVEALIAGLRELGHVEGRNLFIESRWADGSNERLDAHAVELVALKLDVIVGIQTPASQALQKATRTTPIVMAAIGDPIGTGLVTNFARPGGNITGVTTGGPELQPKAMEIFREISPGFRRLGVLANAADPYSKTFLAQVQSGAKVLGIETSVHMLRSDQEYSGAFDAMSRARVGAVIVQGSLTRKLAVELALKYRVPAISGGTYGLAEEGGLMTYAAPFADLYRDVAGYVDKIIKGAKPGDLPVQQPTRYALVINLKTAKRIGLNIPRTVLVRADKLIE